MTEQQLGSIARVQTHRHEGATRGRKQKRGKITAVDHSYLPAASQTWLSALPCYLYGEASSHGYLHGKDRKWEASQGMEGLRALRLRRGYALAPCLLFYGSLEKECSPDPAKSPVPLLSSTALSPEGFPPLLAVTALIYNLKAPAPFFQLPLPPRLCRKLYPAFISIIAN